MRLFILTSILTLELSWFLISNHYINPELEVYNQFFVTELYNHCDSTQYYFPKKTTIDFGPTQDHEVGVCERNMFKFNIFINKVHWAITPDSERFSTLMHEFTHCYLHEDHSLDPSHFMYFKENRLSKKIVIQQLKELLKLRCGR